MSPGRETEISIRPPVQLREAEKKGGQDAKRRPGGRRRRTRTCSNCKQERVSIDALEGVRGGGRTIEACLRVTEKRASKKVSLRQIRLRDGWNVPPMSVKWKESAWVECGSGRGRTAKVVGRSVVLLRERDHKRTVRRRDRIRVIPLVVVGL